MAFNILVLCTGNSARSILGEAILQRQGNGRIQAYSAGSQPKSEPHPFALELLRIEGFETTGFHSKSWDIFSKADAPKINLVITVCDAAFGESCPVFLGAPLRIHWGLEDPAAIVGTAEIKAAAFRKTYTEIMMRAKALAALPFEILSAEALQAELSKIGKMEGATALSRTYSGQP